jgi:heme exporter protein C
VHFSVEWWRTLHQEATVFNPELSANIDGVMALTLWISVIAFTIVYVYLLDRRYRLASLEAEMDAREVAAAIADRVGEPVEVGR